MRAQLHVALSSEKRPGRAIAGARSPAMRHLPRGGAAGAELLYLVGAVEAFSAATGASNAEDARMLGGERLRAVARIVPDREPRATGGAVEAEIPLARGHIARLLGGDVVSRLES